jgi:hypothetical protein
MKGKKTGGRKTGTPNKISTDVRKALDFAFKHSGNKKALTEWAKNNREAFYRLWSRMMGIVERNPELGEGETEYEFEIGQPRRWRLRLFTTGASRPVCLLIY